MNNESCRVSLVNLKNSLGSQHALRRAAVLGVVVVAIMVATAGKASADENSGTWCGQWVSCKSGHNGPLEATICQVNDHCYRADFRGRFAKILPFRYSVTLNVVERGPGYVRLSGSSYLGRIMGDFCYEAVIENGCLRASYRAKRDWGTWTLKRICN